MYIFLCALVEDQEKSTKTAEKSYNGPIGYGKTFGPTRGLAFKHNNPLECVPTMGRSVIWFSIARIYIIICVYIIYIYFFIQAEADTSELDAAFVLLFFFSLFVFKFWTVWVTKIPCEGTPRKIFMKREKEN